MRTDERGRADYEADVRRCPTYPDGGARKTWEQLNGMERWTWNRNPSTCAACGESWPCTVASNRRAYRGDVATFHVKASR